MLKLLERGIETIEDRLVLLAPPQASVYPYFRKISVDPIRHHHLVREVQRLRGGIYFRDGAIDSRHLTSEGLHRTPEDDRSWHLLMQDGRGDVTACVWYMEHDSTATFERLRLRNCPLARDAAWGSTLRLAVEQELSRAQRNGLRYAEVGGWAVAERCRCKSEGLLLALAAYSLGRMRGGALGVTTATVRHSSSTILKRIGGQHLQADSVTIPPYFDERYKCEIELLRFDSRRPDAKYGPLVELLRHRLAGVAVIVGAGAAVAPTLPYVPSFGRASVAA